jgi:hypothetical protein
VEADDGERREAWVEPTDPPVRAGFRVLSDPAVAGGRLEVEFELVLLASSPAYLAVTTDRMAGRLADYEFVATPSTTGRPLADPAEDADFMGGPATAARLVPGEPFTQAFSLDRYVALGDAPPGTLTLRCSRRLGIAASQEAALAAQPVTVQVDLVLNLRAST